MASPRISVVVPFFNVADLLGECLQSIAAQTYGDLEVIMVDDGSTDGSTAVASAQAAADPRFILHRVANGGPGYARNRGIELARGEFLAFADGDDMVPPHAYEVLLHTLEESGSDFVCGNVNRIGPWGVRQSALHSRAIKGRRIGTHITKTPQLLYDISVFNKLFRKEFWDANELSFPEGMLWEDLQLMTKAHVLARAVDVIPDHVYLWRERGLGELSITQSRTDIQNLRDRIDAVEAIDAFLAAHAPAKLLRRHQHKALTNDLWLYVGDLHKVTDAYRAEFIALVGRYLSQVRPRVLAGLPATQKLAYHLISRGRMAELLDLLTWQLEQPVRAVPLVRRRGRLLADLPLRTDPQLRIPAKIFHPHWRELDPMVRVDEIGWHDDNLVISGRAYIPSLDIASRRNTSKIVVLRPRRGRRRPIIVRASSFRSADATEQSSQERYSYDWAGFRCEIRPRRFRRRGGWITGEWECYILVRSRLVWRPARIHTPATGQADRPGFRDVAPGVRFRARWEGRNLVVEMTKVAAELASCAFIPGPDGRASRIELDVDLPRTAAAGQPARLVLARQGGATALTFPAAPGGAGDAARLRAGIDVGALLAGAKRGEQDTLEAGGATAGPADTVSWEVWVSLPGLGRRRVAVPAGAVQRGGGEPYGVPATAMSVGEHGSREIAVGWSRYGDLVIADRVPRPIITGHSWTADGRLRLTGTYPGPPSGLSGLVLRRNGAGEQYPIPCRWEGSRFTADIDASHMPLFGRKLPLRDGRWNILFAVPARDGDPAAGPIELLAVGYDLARVAAVGDEPVEAGAKEYRFTVVGEDTPVLDVAAIRRRLEHGRFNQRVLRHSYYAMKLRAPLRDAVVFVSWKGKQCTDNPLGIAAELRSRGDDRQHIWVVTDPAVPVPDGGRGVLMGSQEYYDAIARARYLVANDDMPAHYRKRDGQIYLQTWHGTPLKRIGFDVEHPQFVSGAAYLDHLADDVAKWDLLLSQNPFSTPILRRAFRFAGEICEYGYPRNDMLSRPGTAQLAATVRARLGLPAGKTVVLYAPTWRDNQFYSAGRYRFDLRLDLERARAALGGDCVVLIRGHHHMADDVPEVTAPGFAVNVTRYPDISELFLVSDILLTDYSSAMFDYASTGKPILFFTYDLENYRDNLRGFYFDFEPEAPGPLLATSDDVISAIRDIDAVSASYVGAYRAFVAKFCPLDDGKAGARVCDRLFTS